MIIAVDFDGTLVTHDYPEVGHDIGAAPVLKTLVKLGHKLILYTMRSGDQLSDAIQWCKDRDIELWAVNENPEQKDWTLSPKIYANLYIDDAALGVPLIKRIAKDNFWVEHHRMFVDWDAVKKYFVDKGMIPLDMFEQ